jgi:hypothetical protein
MWWEGFLVTRVEVIVPLKSYVVSSQVHHLLSYRICLLSIEYCMQDFERWQEDMARNQESVYVNQAC